KDENGLVAGRHVTFSKKGKYSMRAATEFLTTETQGRSREDVHMARQEIVPPLHRAESFTRGLIPGAAPDGLPQAIELSCAFSADLVSRAPRWDRRESCPPDARAANNEIVPSLQDGVFY